MQDAATGGGDLLRLAVMQALDESRRRNGLWIGAEEARRIGPDLEAPRLELAGEVRARGIGAVAPEQYRLALRVARDEALRQNDAVDRSETRLQTLVRRKVATRRDESRALRLIAQRRALEVLADIEPLDVEALAAQIRGAELGRGQLAYGKHARMHAGADLANELGAGDDLRERREALVEHSGVDAELVRERIVLRADPRDAVVGIASCDRRIEQSYQRIRDADERGVNYDGANALLEPLANEPRDDGPVLRRGDAAAAE